MVDDFNDVANVWLKKLNEHADGSTISMLEYLTRATMAAIVKVHDILHMCSTYTMLMLFSKLGCFDFLNLTTHVMQTKIMAMLVLTFPCVSKVVVKYLL